MDGQAVHVNRSAINASWVVTKHGESSLVGTFRRREYALAFARAIAHRSHVEMIEHAENGRLIRYPAASLSYPVFLA